MKLQSGVYWNIAEARTSTSVIALKVTLWDSFFNTDQFVILHLQLQGFSTFVSPRIRAFVTRPFPLRVWSENKTNIDHCFFLFRFFYEKFMHVATIEHKRTWAGDRKFKAWPKGRA